MIMLLAPRWLTTRTLIPPALSSFQPRRYELAPWRRAAVSRLSPNVSSHTSAVPILRHRTYISPVSVKSLAVTRTTLGITTPTFLLGTEGNGVLMVDRRLLDPRRPNGEPTEQEKAEGLAQYQPHLPYRHAWLLTHGTPVHRLRSVVAVPASFESTTLVVAVGESPFLRPRRKGIRSLRAST